MRTLVFEPTLTGHHLEYLHHIYLGAVDRPDIEFIIAVPRDEWKLMREKRIWSNVRNIQWMMLDDEVCRNLGKGSMLQQSWMTAKFIRNKALAVNADNIFLISLASAIPFLPLILPSRIKLSGIIYKIYLRAPKHGVRGLIDKIRYTIMAHSHSIGKILILNDPNSTCRLNQTYHTSNFVSLPDPVPVVDQSRLCNLRQEFGAADCSKIFLHFGAMDERKGTLVILRALCLMTKEELSDKVFIFAGRVGNVIKDEFYQLADKATNAGANIIIIDEFCAYDYLNSLCYTADCILIPYIFTDLSSGALGYAAVHNTPVIGPSSGLIGELIRSYRLGQTIEKITAESIKDSINRISRKSGDSISDYSERNTIRSFQSIILDCMKK